MNQEQLDRLARTVLYERYLLYPYRPSVKNHQRWTFGGLYPRGFCEAEKTGYTSSLRAECLIEGNGATTVQVTVRFLHLTSRILGDSTWQEAIERSVPLEAMTLEQLSVPYREGFQFEAGNETDAEGVVRTRQAIEGSVIVSAKRLGDGISKVVVRVENDANWHGGTREDAVLVSLASTHVVLAARDGGFVSLLDPPECWREFASGCKSEGAWPTMVGVPGERDTVLASPIILYDYPEIAPESPGDFFDGTEIDAMLTLRILTMTDEEKAQMVCADSRARSLLERTESLGVEQLRSLHGTMR